jgi:TrpR-related protein YerC/YecD
MNKKEAKWIKELYEVILDLQDPTEARKFFRDLMTEQELVEFGRRWRAAQMLEAEVPYVEIVEKTGLSSTTVARVAKWLHKGMKGYKLALAKQKRKHHCKSSSFEKGLR